MQTFKKNKAACAVSLLSGKKTHLNAKNIKINKIKTAD